MASLRDRAEALLEDVGLEGSGKLADDVRAVAEAVYAEVLIQDKHHGAAPTA